MSKYINLITILRVLLAPTILAFMIFEYYSICLILFIFAGFTDYLDGYLARKYSAESDLGEILDPIADKVLIIFIFIGLSVSLDSFLLATMSSLIISREIGIAALRDYASRNGLLERTKVTFLAKVKTSIQMFTIVSYLLSLTIKYNLLLILSDIMLIMATLITLYTGYQYTINVTKK